MDLYVNGGEGYNPCPPRHCDTLTYRNLKNQTFLLKFRLKIIIKKKKTLVESGWKPLAPFSYYAGGLKILQNNLRKKNRNQIYSGQIPGSL